MPVMNLTRMIVKITLSQLPTMLPPFSLYLQSNQAPSEDETRKIKALRANPLKEISIINVEIEQIEGILNSLKRKRAHIQESIDNFNTILSPVRRLSTDVLGVIFSHCLATHRNSVMSASEAPILLTHICRDWRSVALSIPQLWSRLYIPTFPSVPHYIPTLNNRLETLPYDLQIKGERRLEARTQEVKRWLKHSSVYPLAITLMPAGEPVFHRPLLDAIIESSRRWQQLELGFLSPGSDTLHRLLSLSPDDLCMLRELRIHSLHPTANLHSQDMQEDLWHQSGLLTAQGLRSISIAVTSQMNAFDAGIPPNWKNLNHLSIHSPIFSRLAHRILTYCCNLAVCLLEISWQWDDTDTIPGAPQAITLSSCILPHLIFLSFQGDFNFCSQLFSCIEAPSLKILDYHGVFPSPSEEFGLLNLLQNINSLKMLRMDPRHLTESNVLKYYTHIPSVTHLVLGRSPKRGYSHNYTGYRTFNPYDGTQTPNWGTSSLTPIPSCFDLTILHEFRHQYSPDSSPTLLFPLLEIFEAYDISGVTDIMLLEFIKARIDATKSSEGVSKLKKVLVEFSGTRQIDIVPEALAYAQAAGIKLELDLTYYSTGKEFDATWSPSFGLSPGDVSWQYSLYD